jgi:hypothetical protein
MALEYVNESSILKTEDAIREFIRYMNDPHDITTEGAALLCRARELCEEISDFNNFSI